MDYSVIQVDGADTDPLVYWSFGIAAVSLLWGIYWSYFTYKRSNVQAYWFNEVVGPRVVVPLLEFYEEWAPRIEKLQESADASRAADGLNEFGEKKDVLLKRLWISKLLFTDIYDSACDDLDALEDSLGNIVERICAQSAGAKLEAPDYDSFLNGFESKVLALLKRMVSSRLVVPKH